MKSSLVVILCIIHMSIFACPICFNKNGKVKKPYFHEDNIDNQIDSFDQE